MKQTGLFILLLFLTGSAFAQADGYQCKDTLIIKISSYDKLNELGEELLHIYCKDDSAFVTVDSGYTIKLVPKEGLDKERLHIARKLIKAKHPERLPEKYSKHLSISRNDSLSVLRLSEEYKSRRTFSRSSADVIACIKEDYAHLSELTKQNSTDKMATRTKVECKEGTYRMVYYMDGRYNSEQLFRCLFSK